MPDYPYAAFLSYASSYGEWVETLQANLEATLAHHGCTKPIFLDRVDIEPGESWVTKLSASVDQAEKFLLVVTPEAMASPRVGEEWEGFATARRDWSRRNFLPIMLVWAPLPTFVGRLQYVDLRGHDDDRYRQGIRELAAAILGITGRRRLQLDLPSGLDLPRAPKPAFEDRHRQALVEWLEAAMRDDSNRPELEHALDREFPDPASYGGVQSAASALLVDAANEAGGDAIAGAREVVAKILGRSGSKLGVRARQRLEVLADAAGLR